MLEDQALPKALVSWTPICAKIPEPLLYPIPPVKDPVLCSLKSKIIMTCPGFSLSGPRDTLTSSNKDVEYNLFISASKIFLLNI